MAMPETVPADGDAWPQVRAHRKAWRAERLAARKTLPADFRQEVTGKIVRSLARELDAAAPRSLGFYWPIKGELDLRPLLLDLIQTGVHAAVPVVVEKDNPVEFWRWWPGMKMTRGHWNIPVPAERDPVTPDVLIVPLVGFDTAGFRLGYGGGYYDRTLAAARPRPLAIGVGLESARLETIHPQPHDFPMDIIVTEARLLRFHRGPAVPGTAAGAISAVDDEDPNETRSYASPPCFMHELDS